MTYLILACRYVVGGVLLAAAVRKASGRATFAAFAGAVRRLGGVPAAVAPAAAAAVIGVEAMVGGSLLAGLAPAAALLAAVVVLVAFTIALVLALRGGSREPCLCLGRTEEPVAWRHVWRNAGLIGAALLGLAGTGLAGTGLAGTGLAGTGLAGTGLARIPLAGDSWELAAPTVPGRLLCLAAAAVAVLVIVLLDDLAALFRA